MVVFRTKSLRKATILAGLKRGHLNMERRDIFAMCLLLVAGGVGYSSALQCAEEIPILDVPFAGSVMYQTKGNAGHRAGGTLYAAKRVVTAAHAFSNVSVPTDYFVMLGTEYLPNQVRPDFIYPVRAIHVHPTYDFDNKTGVDLAWLELESAPSLSPTVQIAPLAQAPPPADHHCFEVGWGKETKDPYARISYSLKYLRHDYVQDQASCLDRFGLKNDTFKIFCTDSAPTNITPPCIPSACKGDSGGPVVCRNPSSGEWTLYGAIRSVLFTEEEKRLNYSCPDHRDGTMNSHIEMWELRDFLLGTPNPQLTPLTALDSDQAASERDTKLVTKAVLRFGCWLASWIVSIDCP